MSTESQQKENLPGELSAVLRIFAYDEELKAKTLPHVNIERQPKIWANDFGGGHSAAFTWAQAIWCDKVETKSHPFDRTFAIDPNLQITALETLSIRWGFWT